MSTSPKPAPSSVAVARSDLQPFPYDTLSESGLSSRSPESFDAGQAGHTASNELSSRIAEAQSVAHSEGFQKAKKLFDEQMARERASIASALARFAHDRAVFFQKVEGEIVALALSIARKILHREAQVDPLLLAGIVRVALEKIDGATGVRLRVHPTNATEWSRSLALQLDARDLPKIVEDPSQTPDSCVIETAMGTATLGLEVQLKEIECGLMDLLAARPGVTS